MTRKPLVSGASGFIGAHGILEVLNGKYPLLPSLGVAIVDVRDVAVPHRLACEILEAAGRRFICSSGFRSWTPA